MSSYVFAMSGQKIYLEMMAEMRRPEQFPRSLYTATPTVLLSYAFVCGTGYILRGDRVPRYLMAVLQYDVKRSVSNFLMLIHIVISYVLNQQVLCRVRLHSLACCGCRTRAASLSHAPAPAPLQLRPPALAPVAASALSLNQLVRRRFTSPLPRSERTTSASTRAPPPSSSGSPSPRLSCEPNTL